MWCSHAKEGRGVKGHVAKAIMRLADEAEARLLMEIATDGTPHPTVPGRLYDPIQAAAYPNVFVEPFAKRLREAHWMVQEAGLCACPDPTAAFTATFLDGRV